MLFRVQIKISYVFFYFKMCVIFFIFIQNVGILLYRFFYILKKRKKEMYKLKRKMENWVILAFKNLESVKNSPKTWEKLENKGVFGHFLGLQRRIVLDALEMKVIECIRA